MGIVSRFWLFTCKLVGILFIFTDLSTAASDCQVFQGALPCLCSIVSNDRGVVLGNSVDCSSKGLQAVPTPNASYVTPIYELRLNNNSIPSLGDNILSSLTITKLDLSDNPIRSVHDNTFGSLGNSLTILILSGNLTSQPPKHAFGTLSQLEELTLRNYEVTELYQTDAYFLPFTKLRHLTLDNWKLRVIAPDSFQMSNNNFLLSLTLLNQVMESLPIDIFNAQDLHSLKKLRISGTLINNVGNNVFSSLNNIQEIDLSSNHINTLEINCFNYIEDTLVSLSLSGNILTQDATKLSGLTKLTNLQKLDLSFNSIKAVPNLSQLGTTKPLDLFLNNNKITSLTENSFAGIANKLRALDLSQNKINSIHANSFTGTTALEVLYLSGQLGNNNPLIMPQSLTQAAKTLKELHVDRQEINPSEMWSVIWQLPMLEVFNLSSTKLTAIQNMALFNLTNLKNLDLSYNSLTEITQAALAGPRNLQVLSLTGNAIRSLSSCVFYQYTSYNISLAMGNIPLNCDCYIQWLWNRIQIGSVTFLLGQEALCSDKVPLASKKKEDFCTSQITEPQCSKLYTLNLTITLSSTGSNSVLASWQLLDTIDLKNFMLSVTNSQSTMPVFEQNFTAPTTSYTVSNLLSNIQHTFCMTALFYTYPSISACNHTTVDPIIVTEKTAEKQLGHEETGIIIGAVVGSAVLLGILAAIGYLIFFRRKHKEKGPNNAPVQPRNFSKSELPSMNVETRTFSKPPPKPRGTGEHREGMQVVAISDGQTGNMRVGRAEMMHANGSFKSSNSSKPSSTSSYENDRGPLPPIPSRPPSTHLPVGYYNMGFTDDKYDEIGHGKESAL